MRGRGDGFAIQLQSVIQSISVDILRLEKAATSDSKSKSVERGWPNRKMRRGSSRFVENHI